MIIRRLIVFSTNSSTSAAGPDSRQEDEPGSEQASFKNQKNKQPPAAGR
jgi:hypothetical protein